MKDMFQLTHQEFYELRDKFVRPFLRTPGPRGGRRKLHRLTADSLTCLLLRKIHEGMDDRSLGVEFGLAHSNISKILSDLRDHIYLNDRWLQRGRRLHIRR